MKQIIILLSLSTIGCTSYHPTDYITERLKNETDSIIIRNNRIDSMYFIDNESKYTIGYDYYKKGQVATIKGELSGKAYAHNFFFNLNGKIERYSYLLGDDQHHSYSIELINQPHYVEQGTPLVDFINLPIDQNSDLKRLNVLFSSFPRKIEKVLLSYDNLNFKQITLSNYKVIPLIQNVVIPVPQGTQKLYFKIFTIDNILNLKGLSERELFLDSVEIY